MYQENKYWRSTNYHQHVQSFPKANFINGAWYEIGFKNEYQGNFVHQGIRQFSDGFLDDNGYHLKPFPTHAREVYLTIPEGEHMDLQ